MRDGSSSNLGKFEPSIWPTGIYNGDLRPVTKQTLMKQTRNILETTSFKT
jgi:hypothetical protein